MQKELEPEQDSGLRPELDSTWVTGPAPRQTTPTQLPWWQAGDWPGLTRDTAIAIVNEYGAAWVTRDEERIVRIFAQDATYKEHPFEPRLIYHGHEGIRRYWVEHVQAKQRNHQFRQAEESLLLDMERSTVLAKWEAKFLSLQSDGRTYVPVEFVQVAMLTFDNQGLITTLEEYWTSKRTCAKGQRGLSKKQQIKAAKRKPAGHDRPRARVPAAKMWLGAYAMQ